MSEQINRLSMTLEAEEYIAIHCNGVDFWITRFRGRTIILAPASVSATRCDRKGQPVVPNARPVPRHVLEADPRRLLKRNSHTHLRAQGDR